MTAEWSVPAWALLVTLGAGLALVVGLVLHARRSATRAERAVADARAQADALGAQVAAIEARLDRPTPRAADPADDEREYVITRLGDEADDAEVGQQRAAPVDGPLFADLVLREGVVQVASFAAGVRRALAPAHLNRVRFEMRREVKRARKQRRTDLRRAKREYDARARSRASDAAA
jgi:hypothetical protein